MQKTSCANSWGGQQRASSMVPTSSPRCCPPPRISTTETSLVSGAVPFLLLSSTAVYQLPWCALPLPASGGKRALSGVVLKTVNDVDVIGHRAMSSTPSLRARGLQIEYSATTLGFSSEKRQQHGRVLYGIIAARN